MIHFLEESLLLLPFLFGAYLILETVEAKAGGALEAFFGRSRSYGPLIGAASGIIPQCGVSAAAASFFSGGIVSLGTMLAVFLSTSDELLPVLISNKVSFSLLGKIVLLKFLFAAAIGVAVDFISRFFKLHRREVAIHEICEHSRCSCGKHRGVIVPALIHTVEVFVFILLISGAVELAFHYFGEPSLSTRIPLVGEFISGFFGLVPNCAISVASAELYCKGVISAGQLMACSFTSSGVGLLVLFRTNRSFKENLSVVFAVYVFGSILGILSGLFF